jgi:hypothetical protein
MSDRRTEEESRKRLENLRAVLAGPPPSTSKATPGHGGRPAQPSHRARNTALGTIGAVAWFLVGEL